MSFGNRHTFMTRNYIVAQLLQAAPSVSERHEIFDHPAMVSAAKCSVFVKELGRQLGFPTRTISTAQLLLHRTYILRPNPSASTTDLATACLFVAAKMEETIKRLRDILTHSYLISAQSSADPQSVPTATTDKMRPSVLAAEQFVLNAIGYDFRTLHPHLLYVKMAKIARLPRKTVSTGWQILADAYYSTLPVQYPSVVIAAGALCLAWNLDCCPTPHDSSQFIRDMFSMPDSQTDFRSRRSSLDIRNGSRHPSELTDVHFPAQAEHLPQSLNMSDEWWLQFGVATRDIRGFVRQIVDFYLVFFSSIASSTEYLERHKNGLPSRHTSQRIGVWRMSLENTWVTPVSPKKP